MRTENIFVVGGPDTGKTNFLARLWIALQSDSAGLKPAGIPDQIGYIEQIVEHLHGGTFAPRTDQNIDQQSSQVVVPISPNDVKTGDVLNVLIPDVSGEMWRKAVETREVSPDWISQLETSVGALLFVRVLSSDNVMPLDWVNASRLMQHSDNEDDKIPTQVLLCEFLRLIELKLSERCDGQRSRIGVVVTAWDLLDCEQFVSSPRTYLEKEYPLFVGRLDDLAQRFEFMVFGVSIVGGDLHESKFREEFLRRDVTAAGFVKFGVGGTVRTAHDVTLPLSWVLRLRDIDG